MKLFLQIEMVKLPMPEGGEDMEMICFPFAEVINISGVLVKTSQMGRGIGGTVVYLTCDDCSVEESRVGNAGGKVLQPKMSIGDYGFCSLIMDTVGLHSMA